MPILNTSNEVKNLVVKFIADDILQVLLFFVENERKTMKQSFKLFIMAVFKSFSL